jgi:hypothetical protein
MAHLSDLSDEALEKELARRRKAKDAAAVPQPLPAPDFTPLVAMLVEHTKAIAAGDADEIARHNDFKHAAYELAVDCIYGRSYWEWLRSKF